MQQCVPVGNTRKPEDTAFSGELDGEQAGEATREPVPTGVCELHLPSGCSLPRAGFGAPVAGAFPGPAGGSVLQRLQ